MNADVTNPEELLVNDGTAEYALDGIVPSPEIEAAARNLARELIKTNPLALAKTISYFAEYGGAPPNISNAMVDILFGKILNATPDQLTALAKQARDSGVWEFVLPAMQHRNDVLAESLLKYTNVAAIDELLDTVSLGEAWVPSPIYHAGIKVLRQLAKVADITKLDAIAEVATAWRMKTKVMPAVSDRNWELTKSIAKYETPYGYAMRNGSHSVAVEKPLDALRKEAHGYKFITVGG